MLKFISTRGSKEEYSGREAVLTGLAPDGGLFMPKSFPTDFDWQGCLKKSSVDMSAAILSALLPDYENMAELVKAAYTNKFDCPELTPLKRLDGKYYCLELWHGPSSAFKDVALSVLPHLITAAKRELGKKEKVVILTATSGDTGKAALEGFKNVPGTEIIVFYPEEGVSDVQKAQMKSQQGVNVTVCAVKGNFDDCQTGVKKAFAALNQKGALPENITLSSANSINIGRLAPQVLYYFTAYRDLMNMGRISLGDKVDFVVPTGNFGDILAGYFAKLLGLPVGRLVCVSNENNVLTDFFNTGVYDIRRKFLKTASPSMDILTSSNLERLLWLAMDRDGGKVKSCMEKLNKDGFYDIKDYGAKIPDCFGAFYCDDEKTAKTIEYAYDKYSYLCDSHTAVAMSGAFELETENPVVVLSTASPYKFADFVLCALGETAVDTNETLEKLSKVTKTDIPANLKGVLSRPTVHCDCIESGDITPYVKNKIENPNQRCTVLAPASSANLGPGFDSFGIAWQIYNEISFDLDTESLTFEGCGAAYANTDNPAYRGFALTLTENNIPVPPIKITFGKTDIPVCRGLGSSSALTVAGIKAAEALYRLKLTKTEELALATAIEGHPDNAGPVIYGGFTCSMTNGGIPYTVSFPISKNLGFVALVPDKELSTALARAALPKEIAHKDAVFNVSHAAVLIKAIETGDGALLREAMQDKLHQPYRESLIEGYADAKKLAYDLGAASVCISGAGSTILCVYNKESDFLTDVTSAVKSKFPAWQVIDLVPYEVNE